MFFELSATATITSNVLNEDYNLPNLKEASKTRDNQYLYYIILNVLSTELTGTVFFFHWW